MLTLVQKWWAFLCPVPGWKERFLAAKAGKTIWQVPGKPEKPRLVPFPVEWMPHRCALTAEDDQASHARGFVFLPGVCVETGKELAVGVALSCCRCGVTLSPEAAHMYQGFDPPYCSRCRWVIKLML